MAAAVLLRSIGLALLLVLVLTCAIASAVIVTFSNDKKVETWKVQPSVWLAVLSSIVNVSLAILLSIGVTVCWWRTALRGTTVAPLHYIWERGVDLDIISALRAGFNVNKVLAVTTIVTAASFINNPLLQRATGVERQDLVIHNYSINLNLTQRIPDGWMGTRTELGNSFITHRRTISAVQRWWRNDTIRTPNGPKYYCNGTCEGEVEGAGISYNCTAGKRHQELSIGNEVEVFSVKSAVVKSSTGLPLMQMDFSHVSALDDNCSATITVGRCNIEAAVVKYPVILRNDTLALNRDKLPKRKVVSTYSSAGDLDATPVNGIGPLTGLSHFIDNYFGGTTHVSGRDSRLVYDGDGTFTNFFYEADDSNYSNHTLNSCAFKWSSPKEYLFNAMDQFMFLAALHAGNSTATEFKVELTQPVLRFRSDYKYLAVALATMLLALVGVLILLWGWWELERPVTLSPLETAKAFEAPLMRGISRNDIDGILNGVGHVGLKYNGHKIVESDVEMRSRSDHQDFPHPRMPRTF